VSLELKLSDGEDAHVIANMWLPYQHEVSEFGGDRPNPHGLLGAEDGVTTAAEHLDGLKVWWSKPDTLFPYLILVDGAPAGFNLVVARSQLTEGVDADFVVYEFFVMHAYRGGGVAQEAARSGFERHPGSWEVVTYPDHARAIRFWRRTIGAYTSGEFSEAELDHAWGRKVAFQFESRRDGAASRA